jgi:hypothetical protein
MFRITLFSFFLLSPVFSFNRDSLIVLKVNVNSLVPPLPGRTGEVSIDEISTTIIGQPPVTKVLQGVTLTSHSYDLGALSLSSNGVYASFAGLAAPVNTSTGAKMAAGNAWSCSPTCFTGINRVIARISWDGSISTSTVIPADQFEGIVKGVCSVDGSSYFIVGNATDTCDGITSKCPSIGYIQHGSSNLVNVFQAPNPISGSTGTGNTRNFGRSYVSCAVRDTRAYFLRSATNGNTNNGAIVDVVNMMSTSIMSDPFSIAINPSVNADLIAPNTLSPKQILVNRDQTLFWVCFYQSPVGGAPVNADRGIYSGITTKAMIQHLRTPNNADLVTGMTLSSDEMTLYYIARGPAASLNRVFSVSAAPCAGTGGGTAGCLPLQLMAAGAGFEYRGISLAPQAPPSPNPWATATPTPSSSATPALTPSNTPSSSLAFSPSPTSTPSRTPSGTMPSASPLGVDPGSTINENDLIVSYVRRQCDVATGACTELTNASAKLYTIPISTLNVTGRWSAQSNYEMDTGVSVSGNDLTQGSLTSCGDYSCVTFGGFISFDGEVPSSIRPHFSGDRVVVRMEASSSSAFSVVQKSFSTSVYDGLIKGVCARSSDGYFIVGNSSTNYVSFLSETTSAISTLGYLSSYITPATPDIGATACTVSFSGALYHGGVQRAQGGGGGGAATVNAFVTSEKYDTTALGINIQAAYTRQAPFNTRGFVVKAIAMTLNETKTWVCGSSPLTFGIFLINTAGAPVAAQNIINTIAGVAGTAYDCQGMALSYDETMLIFVAKLRGGVNTGKSGLFTISSSCTTAATCTPTLIERMKTGIDIPGEVDVRGLARAPKNKYAVRPTISNTPRPSLTSSTTSSATPTSSLSFGASPSPSSAPCPLNYFINITSGLCTICPAGTFNSNLGSRQCTPCASGFNSYPGQNCTSCPAGQVARPGQSGCNICPPTTMSLAGYGVCADCPTILPFFPDPAFNTESSRTFCPVRDGLYYSEVFTPNVAGGGFVRKPAGNTFPCPPGSSNPINGSTVGCICAAPNSQWVDGGFTLNGQNRVQWFSCRCDISQGYTSRGLTEGAALDCLLPSATCPSGSYKTAPADYNRDIACSLCSVCGEGMVRTSACTATTNTVCSPCLGNTYSMQDSNGNDATVCNTCTAGSDANLVHGGCVCNAANSTWMPDNTCVCAEGFTSGGTSGVNLVCTFQQAPSPTSSITPTNSVSPTRSITPTISESRSVSPTISESATSTPISQTPTPTGSLSFGATPSNTPTISITSSGTPSGSPSNAPSAASVSPTATVTPTASVSPTATVTPTATVSPTISANSASPTISITSSRSSTISVSPSVTGSKSSSLTSSPSVGSKEALLGAAAAANNTAAPTSISTTIGAAVGGVIVVLGIGIAYMHFTRNNKKRKLHGRKNIMSSSSPVEEWKTGGVNPIGSALESANEPVVAVEKKFSKKNRDREARSSSVPEERISFEPVAARDDNQITSIENVLVETTETTTTSVEEQSTWMQCTDTERSLVWYVNTETNETVWALPAGGIVTQVMEQ